MRLGKRLAHEKEGWTTSRARSTTVARYCPLWAPTMPSRFCFWELTSNFPVGHPSWEGVDHFLGPLHHRSTILSALGPDHALTSRATSQWVTHPGSALAPFSLNFGVPTEPEASELPKGLVLGRDGNIHLRIAPLGNVGCYSEHTPH
ncbi:hypothetical protein DVH24_025933 [Malus domestica]|uniref:Uncharacterized protein n=1 Tax=Malus domestica TaxID=3750 RepID=A0A498KHA5_MALDO|nr:hypothetical protein DVH24_025933 [Malus domestica]